MSRPRGRPPQGRSTTIRLPDELRILLSEQSEQQGVSMAELIRRILAAHFSGAVTG